MSLVDLNAKNSGTIWSKKPNPRLKDGLLLEISNTLPGLTSQGSRRFIFTRLAFGCQGAWLAVGDVLGNIYVLDLARNKYRLVFRAGQACTALACCTGHISRILVALADCTIRCINTDSGDTLATLRGHEMTVKSLSLHSSGRLLLATSSRDCVLWDLSSYSRCRTLNGGQEVGVQDVFFQPHSDVIFTCFKDSSVHAWHSATMDYLYRLPLPSPLPPPHPHSTPNYRTFAITGDGEVLVAGGSSSLLYIWVLSSRRLEKLLQLPLKVRLVKQLFFLPPSVEGGRQVLGVLSQDGIVRFLDPGSCHLLCQLGSHDQPLSHACPSRNGRYLAALSESGHLLIYDLIRLTNTLTPQPPAPLVKVSSEEEGEEEEEREVRRGWMKGNQRRKTTKKSVSGGVQRSQNLLRNNEGIVIEGGGGAEGQGGKEGEREGGGEGGLEVLGLDPTKLLPLLNTHGEYPAKYRSLIWRYLLRLPSNHVAYSSLLEQGTHSAYQTLHQYYPIRNRRLGRVLQRALSTLAHWCPVFSETDYLPSLVFPFVKLFQNNQLVTFELLATLLANWCRDWFDYFPNPPLNVLAMVENCLSQHDPLLLRHLVDCDITTHQYAWPLLRTMFSEVLSRAYWLRLWDHIISNPPGFLLLLTASFLSSSRATLLRCTTAEDFQHFLQHPPALDVGVVIQEAYHMQRTTHPDVHPEKLLGPLVPLTTGTYPVFNKYPKFVVDYQVRERERIRSEEEDYLRQRQGALEMERVAESRRHEEETWLRQQQLLLEAEEQRRRTLAMEEKKLSDQRACLQAMKREMKVRELRAADDTRRKFVDHQRKVKEVQLRRLDEQIKKKVVQRDVETQAALEEVDLRALELERQRVQLQNELARCQEEMLLQLDMEQSADNHRHSLHHSVLEREEEGRLAAAHGGVARAQVRRNCIETLMEAERRRAEDKEERRDSEKEVLRRKGEVLVREREVERLARELEESHLNTLAHHLSQEEEGEKGRRERDKGHTLDATTHEVPSAVWLRRRDRLDWQEAELLRRVRGVREKVVANMAAGSRAHSRTDSSLSSPLTHTSLYVPHTH